MWLLLLIYLMRFIRGGLGSNIILVLTDDQDITLGGMIPMKNTINLIANQGITFENAFVNAPICCPSRSSILTGRLPHNTNVVNNSITGGCSSTEWRRNLEPKSLAPILKNAGYSTFYAGKYLNQYGTKSGGNCHVPTGWTHWYGLVGNSKYYNFDLSENGVKVHYKNVYLTDLITEKAVNFLKNQYSNPFFMVLAPPAPHAPFTPAPRHRGIFPEVQALRTPAFNYTPIKKHWLLTMPPVHLPEDVTKLDKIQEHRFETLAAVDEMVRSVIDQLDQIGQLNNTYIIYTSDNGYHIGQFGQPWDKRQPYDTDIRIPLLIRGPKLQPKQILQEPVQSVDLAPSILQMANCSIPAYMDGKSFLNDINGKKINRWEKNILIEYHGEGNRKSNDEKCPGTVVDSLAECGVASWCKCQDARNNTYNCLRRLSKTENILFCKFKDSENFTEAYDMKVDMYQLNNIYEFLPEEKRNYYSNILEKLLKCKGKQCSDI